MNPSREKTKFSGTYGDRGIFIFPCSADYEQDWQPYSVDPYSAICDDHITYHTYIYKSTFVGRFLLYMYIYTFFMYLYTYLLG